MSRLVLAEIRKIARQKSLFLSGFLLVPVFALLVKFLMHVVIFRRLARSDVTETIDLFAIAARSMSISGNSLASLFFALGVASIFAVDYRYGTWRHLVPRRSRSVLWLAKFLTAFLFLLLSVMLVIAGELVLTCVVVLGGQSGVALSIVPESSSLFFLSFLTVCLELSVLAGLASLITILARSSMPAVIIIFLFALGTTLANAYLGHANELWWLPAETASRVRDAISGSWSPDASVSMGALLAWAIGLPAVSCVIFRYQELPNE